jgi:hypothetical protein
MSADARLDDTLDALEHAADKALADAGLGWLPLARNLVAEVREVRKALAEEQLARQLKHAELHEQLRQLGVEQTKGWECVDDDLHAHQGQLHQLREQVDLLAKYMDQLLQGQPTPPAGNGRTCEVCGTPLVGHQRRFCCKAHSNLVHGRAYAARKRAEAKLAKGKADSMTVVAGEGVREQLDAQRRTA